MTSKERIKELQKLVGASQDGVIGNETLSKFAQKYSKNRVQTIHFFANIHHESAGFSIERENLNYTSVDRIMAIFGTGVHSARITRDQAKILVKQPYKLAERVYGILNPSKARELGNTKTGDGWKYRGGGAIQITGGDAFMRFGGGELYNNPDLVGTSAYYFTTALAYFDQRNIWALCTDLSDATARNVCKRINGGLNGISERISKIKYYDSLFKTPPTYSTTYSTTSDLNVREGAGTNFRVLWTLPKGTIVKEANRINDWSRIISPIEGWCNNKYLK